MRVAAFFLYVRPFMRFYQIQDFLIAWLSVLVVVDIFITYVHCFTDANSPLEVDETDPFLVLIFFLLPPSHLQR